jgi:hypothetical protein
MGGLIARYAAMYGNDDLPEGDAEIRPSWAGAAHISKIVMIGVPNEGAADAFATLIDGYSVTEGLRRRVPLLNQLSAEDSIRTPSLFQLLPHGASVRFLDENLQPLQIDLYDPEVWKRYGWSPINNPEFRRKYSARAQVDAAHSEGSGLQILDAYFVAVLKRAERFQQALDASSTANPPVILLAIGGDCEETLNSPVLIHDAKQDRWLTLIHPREYRTSIGSRITQRQLIEAMYAPGDGRVTRASLLGEDMAKRTPNGAGVRSALSLTYAVFGCDLHGQLQSNKTLQDNALTAIVGEVMK